MGTFLPANVGSTGVLRIKKNGVETSKYRPDLGEGNIDLTSMAKKKTNGSFKTINGGLLDTCFIKAEPVQDLHGYSKPWAPGAGKNILPITVNGIKEANGGANTWNGNSKVVNNVTFEILTDSDNNVIGVRANGTASSSANARLWLIVSNSITTITQELGALILNGAAEGATSGVYGLILNRNTSQYIGEYGSGVSISATDVINNIYIGVDKGQTVNNKVFYPMLRLASVSDETFEPYSNICPIEGHTEIDIENTGKNKLPLTVENVKKSNTSGTWSGNVYTKNDVTFELALDTYGNITKITANGTANGNADLNLELMTKISAGDYILSGCPWNGSESTYCVLIGDGSARVASDYGSGSSFTISAAKNIQALIRIGNGTQVTNKEFLPMIRLASENYTGANIYAPYEHYIQYIKIGQTVYGLRGDAVSGKWEIVSVKQRLLSSFSWNLRTGTDRRFDVSYGSTIIQAINQNDTYICSHLEPITLNNNTHDFGTFYISGSWLVVHDSNSHFADLQSFKDWLNEEEVYICYKIMNPIPINLTPQHIEALKSNDIELPLTGQSLESLTYKELFDFDDVEEIIPDTDIQTTYTGQFETATGGKLESCVVDLDPIQDLHGYSKPWVGGEGKNKLPMTVSGIKAINTLGIWSGNEYTFNGVKFTVNTDEDGNVTSIKTTGTASALSYLYFQKNSENDYSVFAGKSCILNGCPANGSTSTYVLGTYGSGMTVNDVGNGVNITFPSTEPSSWNISITIISGYAIPTGGLTFYPMIRLASVSDATFEPYTNICGISGHTQVEVLNRGFNLWDEQWEVGRYNNTTGAKEAGNNDRVRNKNYIHVKPNTQYYLKLAEGGNVYFYDSSKNYISYSGYGMSASFTTPQNCYYINFFTNASYGSSYKNDICINVSDTSKNGQYIPYQGQDVTVNLGGTYYGGKLDVVSGKFTGYVVGAEFDGSNDENWSFTDSVHIAYIELPSSAKYMQTPIANWLMGVYSEPYHSLNNGEFAFPTNTSVKDFVNIRVDSIANLSAWKTFLASNPLQVCYELETPLTIQLTPTQINTLIGENHLDVPLEGQSLDSAVYRELFAWDDVNDVVKAVDDKNADVSAIGTDESGRTTASRAYSIGKHFYKDGKFCTAKTAIASGETFTLNTNYVEGDIASVLDSKVYGFRINGNESNPSERVTYLADAVSATPAKMNYTTGLFEYGSWADAFFMPRPCILGQNGQVLTYLDKEDFSKDTDGNSVTIDGNLSGANVMIEFPKIWYKVIPSQDGKSADVYIASEQLDSTYKDYAYIDVNGTHKKHFYMPAYSGSLINNTLRSVSGQQAMKSKTTSAEVGYAQANGTGWYIEDAGEIMLINFLLILMGKSTDTQTVFGQGLHTGGSEAINDGFRTGVHNTKGMFYGTNSGTIASGSYGNAVKVFGIENYWGFQLRRYAGDINASGTRKIKLCYGTEDGSTTSSYNYDGTGYVDVGATPSGTNGGYISEMKFTTDGMFSKVSSGSASTHYCDAQWFKNDQTNYAARSGPSGDGSFVGAFYVDLYHIASFTGWNRSASLSYK